MASNNTDPATLGAAQTRDEGIMKAGERLAQGAPPLIPAQVDLVVSALRLSDKRQGDQAAA